MSATGSVTASASFQNRRQSVDMASLRLQNTEGIVDAAFAASKPSNSQASIGEDEDYDGDSDGSDSLSRKESSGGIVIDDRLTISTVMLHIIGIFPWAQDKPERFWRRPSTWYQWLILAIACLALFSGLDPHREKIQDNRMKGTLCYTEGCLRVGLLSDLPLALGAFLGLLSLATYTNSRDLLSCCNVLRAYSERESFEERWSSLILKDLAATVLIWFLVIVERIRGTAVLTAALDGRLDARACLHLVLFAMSSLILSFLTFCMLYVVRALMCVVEGYCALTVGGQMLEQAVPRWNTVQAILRKGSGAIQGCLFVLQGTLLFAFLLGVVDVYLSWQQEKGYVSTLIPHAMLGLGVFRIFFAAAKVTEKCERVPSLINSCTFSDDELDEDRQYVVEYVVNSAAGFHIFEIRLTSAMTVKVAYLFAIASFTLTTQIVQDSSGDVG